MYKYQNVSPDEQVIVSEGDVQPRRVAPGGEVVSSIPLENPNLKLVSDGESKPEQSASVQSVQQRNPSVITGPAKQDKEGVDQ